LKSLKLL